MKDFILQLDDYTMNVSEIKLLLENEKFLKETMKFNDYRVFPEQMTQYKK